MSWIEVEEELPEVGKEVTVHYDMPTLYQPSDIQSDATAWLGEENNWLAFDKDGKTYKLSEVAHITHWREKPAPPRPKKPKIIREDVMVPGSEYISRLKMREDMILVDPDPDSNKIRLAGPDGKPVDLFLDTRWTKEHNSTSGILMVKPGRISEGKGYTLKNIPIGSRAYFHFNAIGNAGDSGAQFVDEQGHEYKMIHIDLVYCFVVPDGTIIPIGDNVLVEGVLEDDLETRAPSGIVKKLSKSDKLGQGVIKFIAEEWDRPEPEFKVGDHIFYSEDSDIPLKVSGKVFYRMKHKDIIGLVTGQKLITCDKCGTVNDYAVFWSEDSPQEVELDNGETEIFKIDQADYACNNCKSQILHPVPQWYNMEQVKMAFIRRYPGSALPESLK